MSQRAPHSSPAASGTLVMVPKYDPDRVVTDLAKYRVTTFAGGPAPIRIEGLDDARWVLAATVLFVAVSQLKINVTNAYAGSLAWSNFFARLTHSHPGRVVWMVFNTAIALALMEMNVFQALGDVLGLYSNIAIAWMIGSPHPSPRLGNTKASHAAYSWSRFSPRSTGLR